jgi:hypothetical protein
MPSTKVIVAVLLFAHPFKSIGQNKHTDSTSSQIESITFVIPEWWKNGIDKKFFPTWARFLTLAENFKIGSLTMDSITYLDKKIAIDTFISRYCSITFSSEVIAELRDTSKTKYEALEVLEKRFRSDVRIRRRQGTRHYRIARMKYCEDSAKMTYRYLDFIETKKGYRLAEVGRYGDYENNTEILDNAL